MEATDMIPDPLYGTELLGGCSFMLDGLRLDVEANLATVRHSEAWIFIARIDNRPDVEIAIEGVDEAYVDDWRSLPAVLARNGTTVIALTLDAGTLINPGDAAEPGTADALISIAGSLPRVNATLLARHNLHDDNERQLVRTPLTAN